MVIQFNNKVVGKNVLNGTYSVYWDGMTETLILVGSGSEHYRYTGKKAVDLYTQIHFAISKGRP